MKASYKRNLIIGFGLSLLILIISSVSSYSSIVNLLESTKWVNHTNEVINELENVISTLKDGETGQRGYLLTGDTAFLQPYNGAEDKALSHLNKVQQLTIDNPPQTKSCETLRDIIQKRQLLLTQAIDKKRLRNRVDTADIAKGKQFMDFARLTVQQMESREQSLLTLRTANLKKFTTYTPPLIIIAAILAILITVVFYIKVKSDFDQRLKLQQELEWKDKDINRRIGIIHNVADKIADGNYTIRVQDTGEDGLGNVAFSLNKMAASLEYSFKQLSDNEWRQTGIARLNDTMIGDKKLDDLTNDIISFIASYVHSQVGALYILEHNALRLNGGYALIKEKEKTIIPIGQGLVGQCVYDRKALLLNDIIPENMYIHFAAGEIRPSHVIALPIFDGNIVKGAVELASLTAYSEKELNFLTAISHNIGIVLNRAQSRAKLQELLEETQSQSEELQAQHSEMELLNTELETQAQKLQASEEELKVQQEELLQTNQELEERSRVLEDRNEMIVERNNAIQRQGEELAQSTRYKSEFLANMSHELRTPLNSILLLSRLMSENRDNNLNGEQVEYARVIQSSGKGLLSLIDEILDLSKIEAGKMDLEYTVVKTGEFAQEIKSLFQAFAREKNIGFQVDIQPGVPESIETDKQKLEQIIRNLLSNAFKFTTQGYVSFAITNAVQEAGTICFTVKDTGIGIPEDKQQLVFEAFQQADGSTRRKYGGTGLGLSISRELAKLLHGRIELHSQPNEGSEFSIFIPITPDKTADTPATQPLASTTNGTIPTTAENQRPKTEEIVVKKQFTSTLIPANIPDDRDQIVPGDKIILIIEDDTPFAQSLLSYTRQKGYKGIVSVRGDEGVELAKRFKPMGILLDIQLPIKNGWEVMEDLKNNPTTKPIPVHVMSSHEVKKESLLKGAVDFISKHEAYDKMQEVFQKIENVLSRHPKKVLIVEKNPQHAKALAYFLEPFDVSLEIKHSINEITESLKNNTIDCVILDIGIPAQQSYETLDQIKKIPGLENIPIIIFTGKSLSQTEERKIKKHADSIVVKTAHSYQRILDEVSLFLHLVEENERPKETPLAKYKQLGALNEVLNNRKVLIADDDVRNIFSLTKALEQYNVQVVSAIDGKEALRVLEENPDTDIILMDMMMPEMDGYEATTRIRHDNRWKKIPVIAVTAKAMTGDREKCINAGASDYITKPVDIDQLLSLLRVWLYEKTVK